MSSKVTGSLGWPLGDITDWHYLGPPIEGRPGEPFTILPLTSPSPGIEGDHEIDSHRVGYEGLRWGTIDCVRPGRPIETVPGSHLQFFDLRPHRADREIDNHRVTCEGLQWGRHSLMVYRTLRRRTKMCRIQVAFPHDRSDRYRPEQNCRVGLSPTGKRRLSTAHARSRHSDKMVWKRRYSC